MISTLSSYRQYAADITKSLDRIGTSASVAKETKYYDDHIGKVTSADQFLDDFRLYSYALKAYGLDEQIGSKAFVRKVIESDLSDPKSFANALADSRYSKFAAAFSFKSGAAGQTRVVQSTSQTDRLVEAYSERRVRTGTLAGAAADHFQAVIGTVRSVDQLLDDPAAYALILKTVGADPAITSRAYVRDALIGNLTGDPAANTFLQLADRFNFGADGNVLPGYDAQDGDQTDALVYSYYQTDYATTPQAAAFNSHYYDSRIAALGDVDDLVGDPRLLNYVLTAAGFDPAYETASYVRSILASDPADPASALGRMPTATQANLDRKALFTALNAAFNFDAGGDVPAGQLAQPEEAASALIDGYYKNYQTAAVAKDAGSTSSFRAKLERTKSLRDLLDKDPVFGTTALQYILTAFDIDPATASLTTIRRALESDASDPASFVNKLGDARYEKLSAAFNFDSTGKPRAERLAQSVAQQTATATRYSASVGTTQNAAQKAIVKADTKAYLTEVGGLRSLDDLLSNDTVVDYALKAYGLDKKDLTTKDLRKLFTSDLGDASSYVYSLKDKNAVDLVSAFNFTKAGSISADASVQRPADRLSTENLYLHQTLEAKAGEASEGARLALYFLRKAPDLKSSLSVLADKAIFAVVRTSLGLPDSLSQLDIDRQVKILDARLKVADFSDPKKLDKFITRFSALYDLANADTASPMLGLFTSPSSDGILGSL